MYDIRVVLVDTSHPGNIGAAARAMKTMGLSQLSLVRPQVFPNAQATARAAGADDILYDAKIFTTLEEAIAPCGLVIGSSARSRRLAWPQLESRQVGEFVVKRSLLTPVALVFGCERTGLTNQELDRCHYVVHIPTNPDFSSLNLAAAVQVIAYEIHLAVLANKREPAILTNSIDQEKSDQPQQDSLTRNLTGTPSTTQEESQSLLVRTLHIPAPASEMERFYHHMEDTLKGVGFLHPARPKLLMRRLRRLFHRAQPDDTELKLLRGILTAIQKMIDSP